MLCLKSENARQAGSITVVKHRDIEIYADGTELKEILSETKDCQFECPYQDVHRAPTHPVALQQLVWEKMHRPDPTDRHTDSYWD